MPVLRELLLTDPRPEIRATAAWALGRIGGEDAAAALDKARAAEQEPAVLQDIEKALDVISPSTADKGEKEQI